MLWKLSLGYITSEWLYFSVAATVLMIGIISIIVLMRSWMKR